MKKHARPDPHYAHVPHSATLKSLQSPKRPATKVPQTKVESPRPLTPSAFFNPNPSSSGAKPPTIPSSARKTSFPTSQGKAALGQMRTTPLGSNPPHRRITIETIRKSNVQVQENKLKAIQEQIKSLTNTRDSSPAADHGSDSDPNDTDTSKSSTVSKGTTESASPSPAAAADKKVVGPSASSFRPSKNAVRSVEEAAATLSLPWPSKQRSEDEESPAAKKRTALLTEIQRLLEEHREVLDFPHVRFAVENLVKPTPSTRSSMTPGTSTDKERELDASVDAVLNSLRLTLEQHGVPSGYRKRVGYRESVVPHWNEVETNWPGFERKPLKNWIQYAIPSKSTQLELPAPTPAPAQPPKKQNKSKEKNANNAQAKRERLVHHSGMCQV